MVVAVSDREACGNIGRSALRRTEHILPMRLFFFCLVMVGMGNSLRGQKIEGTLSGVVTDSSGAVVTGATVRLTNMQTRELQTSMSNDSGLYLFPAVSAGNYSLDAEAKGFKREQRTGITVEVNQNARVDFTMQVGSATETVQVRGDATQVDTRDVQLGGTVDTHRVVDLPLNGRNVYDLMNLMPGVVNVSTVLTGAQDMNEMNVNGHTVRQNNYYLDGAFNGQVWRNGGLMPPNPDAVEEFHLITSNFDPEYGRQPGSVMNVVLRSGGNQFHGTAFDFLRNSAQSARNFFQPSVTPLHWNQFGGTLGGPIRKDTTFFFASYQGLRLRTDQFVTGVLVPTAAERMGDFSAVPSSQWPKDPTTKQVFPGGIIPTGQLDPVARNILNKFIPVPGPDGRYSAAAPAPVNDDQGSLKIDHQLTDANRLSGSLFIDQSVAGMPLQNSQIVGYFPREVDYSQYNLVGSDTWTISPHLLSQTHLSATWGHAAFSNLNNVGLAQLGSQFMPGALPAMPPRITVSGYWSVNGSSNDNMPNRGLSATEAMTWIKGDHSLKFGGEFLQTNFREIGVNTGNGALTFNGEWTGNALADYELGQTSAFNETTGSNRNFTGNMYAFFAQDIWRASRRLTIDLGLRWEDDAPFTSAGRRIGNFVPGQQSVRFPTAPPGLVFPGDPGVRNGIAPNILTDFMPRIGLAYDVFGNGRTAIRAGFSIISAAGPAQWASDFQGGPPFFVSLTLPTIPSLVNPWGSYPGGSPFPYSETATNALFPKPITLQGALDPGFRIPYVQEYNLSFQRQLSESMNVQIAYVGNASRHLFIWNDANPPIYIPGASTTSNYNNRRPYLPGTFAAIDALLTDENADYNSLQVTLTRRLSRRVSFLANYTYSKCMDLASDPLSPSFSDLFNLNLDRGPCNYNVPQTLALSWIWQTPEVNHWGRIAKVALGGWQLAGITTAYSGEPLNILSGVDSNMDGYSFDRPDLVGNPQMPGGRSHAAQINEFFNTAAFAKAAGLYGTESRNGVDGPAAVNWNASLSKVFRIREAQSLQLRVDSFNLFNEVNLSAPNGQLTSPNFGKVTAAANGRVLQFALKLLF